VPDSAKAQNCAHFAGTPPRHYVCVPLSAQGELIGVLHVQRSQPSSASGFLDAEMYLVKAVAQHAALALANLGLREKLHEQAIRDNLTGLYNRHHEREWLEQELRRAARDGRRAAVIMVDIDHFKRVNDSFGHDAGDMVLKALAGLFRQAIRGSDIACRHGGEEFLLLLSDASIDGAAKKAEALRDAVERLELRHMDRPLGKLTASFGVAAYPDHAEDADGLLRAADRALYCAKNEGRARVVVASPSDGALSAPASVCDE
jgi:diguanylate cyclase (GGDEF)-like protein